MITINSTSITFNETTYPTGSVIYSIRGQKISFNHSFTMIELTDGFIEFQSIINEETNEPFGSIDELRTFLKINFRSANGGGGSVGGTITPDSRIVPFGDSLTDRGDTQPAPGRTANQSIGYTTFLSLLTGNRLFTPVGGNKGVSGNNTTQMIARIEDSIALNPKVVPLLAATNDLASGTVQSITGNLSILYNAFKGIGAKVIAITILPRFAPNELNATDEAKRLAVNEWIKTQGDANLIVVDAESAMYNTTLFDDGLHTSSLGAFVLGKLVANRLDKLIMPRNMADGLRLGNTYNTNLLFSGTSGTKSGGATGNVANNYYLDGKSLGAIVVGTILNENGLNIQQISVLGNYTATNGVIDFFNEHTTSFPNMGDVLEGMGDIEILSNDPNVLGVKVSFLVLTSAFGTIANGDSFLTLDQLPNTLSTGIRYTLRTPPVAAIAGTPTRVRTYCQIMLKNTEVSTPINFIVRIHKMGVRKVPLSI